MNKKGFTLIELLVTFVILALIGGIGVISYRSFFNVGEANFYKSVENDVLLAGSDYFLDNRDSLPIAGNYSEINLNELVEKKYMEKVVNKNGKECSGKIIAYKENGQYSYDVCLDCGDYKSSGKYCQNNSAPKSITITAKTSNTHTIYNPNLSYDKASYVNNESVIVRFEMINIQVSKYEIVNTKTGEKKTCTVNGTGSVCEKEFTETGTYNVTSYDSKGTVLIKNQQINIKILDNNLNYSIEGINSKYKITKDNCANNKKKVSVSFNIVKANKKDEYKKIEYKLRKNEVDGPYKEITSLSESFEVESGHYELEVIVTNFAGATTIRNKEFNVSYDINLRYDDDNSTGTHEVVDGYAYDYLSKLPTHKKAYGNNNQEIRWYKENERIYGSSTVNGNCTYEIIGEMSTLVPIPENFESYCKNNVIYNGNLQVITKLAPANITFINNEQKNAGKYTVSAHVASPAYKWSDRTSADKKFDCSIEKATPTITLSATSGSTIPGTTITFNEKADVKGKFTVTSSATGKATVTQASSNEIAANTNNLVSVKGVADGSATITVKFTPTDTANYNNAVNKTYAVTVAKSAAIPTTSYCSNPTYTGSEQTIVKTAGTGYTWTAGTKRTVAGSQNVTATLSSGYRWSDNTSGTKTISCKIEKATPTITLSATSGSTIPGTTITFNEKSTVKGKFTVSSSATGKATVTQASSNEIAANTNNLVSVKGVAVGSATITVAFTPTDTANYNNAASKTYAVTIASSAAIPTASLCVARTYTGSAQQLTSVTSGTGYTLSGYSQTKAGEHTITATLSSGYRWSDNTAGTKTFKCTMGKATPTITLSATSGSTIPGTTITFNEKATVKGKFTVTSSATGKATVTQASSNEIAANTNNLVSVKGVADGSATITVKFTPTDTANYNNAVNKTYAVTVAKSAAIPTTSYCSNPTYTGREQTIVKTAGTGYTWTAGTKRTAAGSQNVTATLSSGYRWSDNTSGTKTISCSIAKATPTITLSATSGTVVKGKSVTFNEKATVKGKFTVTSNATGKATVTQASSNEIAANTNNLVTITGVADGSATITVAFTPTDTANYNNAASKTYTVTVTKSAAIPTNSLCVARTYTGSAQQLTSATSGTGYTLSGYSQTNAGEYTITATLSSGYRWSDNATGTKTFKCTIERKAVAEPSCTARTYTGNSQTMLAAKTSGEYTNEAITGTNAGNYSKTLVLNSNYKWSSGSNVTSNRTKTCSIAKATPTITLSATSGTVVKGKSVTFNEKATVKGKFTVTSSATGKATVTQASSNEIAANTNNLVTVTGVADGSATITVAFTPTDTTNYNNAASKTYTVTVTKSAAIPTNSLCVARTYTGNAQQLTSVTSGTGYTLSGYSQTNAGEYTITATLSSGYRWSDNATGTKTFKCTMERKAVAEPSCTARTYTGNSQTMLAAKTSGEYTNEAITGTNAGNYSKTLVLNSNYKWSSGSNVTSNRTKTCSIAKATPTITLSATSGSTIPGTTITFNEKATVKGKFTVSSNATGKATVTQASGNEIAANTNNLVSVKGVAAGSATITVAFTPTDTTNYNNAASKTYTVTISSSVAIPTTSYCSNPTYTGREQTIVKTAGTGYTWTAGTKRTNAGSQNVTASLSSGYRWSDNTSGTKTISCNIEKAKATKPSITGFNVTYDGRSHCPTVSGADRYYYCRSDNTCINWTSDSSVICATNVGSWTIGVKKSGDDNHYESDTATATIKINKAKTSAPSITGFDVTYDGNTHCPTISGADRYYYCTADNTCIDWTTDSSRLCATSVGTWTIGAKHTAIDSNHVESDTATATIKINKAKASAPSITGFDVTYDGKTHCPTVSGGSGGSYVYSYCYSNGTCTGWTTESGVICATNVGSWTARVKISGDSNHNDSDIASATIRIKDPGTWHYHCGGSSFFSNGNVCGLPTYAGCASICKLHHNVDVWACTDKEYLGEASTPLTTVQPNDSQIGYSEYNNGYFPNNYVHCWCRGNNLKD